MSLTLLALLPDTADPGHPGITWVRADDVPSAAEAADAHSPDAVLVTPTTLPWVQEIGLDDLPVVAVTRDDDDAEEAVRGGAGFVVTDISDAAALRRGVRLAHARDAMARDAGGRASSMEALASGIVNELNTPLTYLLFNLAHLNRELPAHQAALREVHEAVSSVLGEDHAESVLGPAWSGCRPDSLDALVSSLQDAVHGANRIRDVVWDLKSFSTSRAETTVEPVQLEHALDAALTIAATQLRHRVQIRKAYTETPWVLASHAQLSQALVHLLLYAVGPIPEGAADRHRITLTTRLEGDRVALEIATPADEPAAGLGMSIGKGLVRSCGGDVEATHHPERGLRVRVTLPTPPRPELSSSGEEAHPHLLVIDDDRLLGRAVRRACEGRFHVTVCESGADAVALLRDGQKFDLVLCDLMMPHMSGMDLYDWIRRERPDLIRRIALMTGGTFTPRATRFLSEVSNPMIEKPFDVTTLPDRIEEILARAGGRES